MRRRGESTGGFTLLEVMIALAILALSLVVLLEIATNNARATNHARLTTIATFLARGKMVQIEDGVLEKGFSDINLDETGDFKDAGYREFSWKSSIERVELPTDAATKVQQSAGDQARSRDPMQAMSGFMGGLASAFIEPIRIGLQEAIRRITLTVYWDEPGRPSQLLEVVAYLTDPARLDMALPGAVTSGGTGSPPGAVTSGGTGAPPGTSGSGSGAPGSSMGTTR